MANLDKVNDQSVINKIKEITGANDQQIGAYIKQAGSASELLSNVDLMDALAKEVEGGNGTTVHSITPAAPKAPAKRGTGRKSRRSNQAVDFGEAIAHVAGQSTAEITAFTETLRQGKQQWVDHTANEILDELRNAPQEVVQAIAQYAVEEEANPEFFRSEASKLCTGLFAIG